MQEEERQERERLRQEWVEKQEKLKSKSSLFLVSFQFPQPHSIPGEEILITYSYWDGSGHRRSITVSQFY